MKQRVTVRNGDGRRPLQSRSAENLTSHKPTAGLVGGQEWRGQTGVGRSQSAHELASDASRDRELPSPCSSRHHVACRYGKRLTAGARQRSRSRDSPVNDRVLSQEEKEEAVDWMHREFSSRRKGLLNGLPTGCTEEEIDAFLEDYFCKTVLKIKERSVRILFPNHEVASEQLVKLNASRFEGYRLSASYGHPDSLLFVGNLSCTYTNEDLYRLFQPHGDILRCFVVCSLSTGLSKGYGFVEFSNRDEAAHAKLQLATKVVGQRSLRVDFADNGMQTCDDLHSRTLFVDRLPKGFVEDDILRDKFSNFGIVNFCQVALSSSGVSRGFAFIDMSTWQEAESAQASCNGASLSGYEIRVSFGMPCRPGACILQHKNSINIPFITGRPLCPTLHLVQKENIPLGDFAPQPPHPSSLQFSVPPMTSVPYKPLHLDVTRPEFIPNPAFASLGSLPSSSSTCNKIAPSSSASDVTSLPPSSSHPPTLTNHTPPSSPPPTPHPSPEDQSKQESNSKVTRKRCAPVLEPAVDEGLMAVYDRPYIGQHQQGIPFTHPLKRIRTSTAY